MTIRLALVIALFLGLTGCTSIPRDAPTYKHLGDASLGKVFLYVYRLDAYPKLRTPSIFVDGNLLFDPPEGAYTVVELPAGMHQINVHWAWDTWWPDLDFPIELKEGSPKFLKITGSLEVIRGKHKLGSRAIAMERSRAESEIMDCCRFVSPNFQ